MPVRAIAASLFIAALHAAAAAQEVELIQFGSAPPPGLVIHVSATPERVDRATFREAPDLASTLAADFVGITSAYRSDIKPLATAINIPRWMKTGFAPSTLNPEVSRLSALTDGCEETPYRPRGDLPASTELRRLQHYSLIAAIACEENIPVALFDALIWQESRYQVYARSPKGAIGLAQLMPGTAHDLGVSDPLNVLQNLKGGARYLRIQLEEFGRYDLALAAYNAGPGRVRASWRIPQVPETVEYVRQIIDAWAYIERVNTRHLSHPRPYLGRHRYYVPVVDDYTYTSADIR